MKIGSRVIHLRLPHLHELVHKGDKAFHSSYLAFESVIGHGPFRVLAALMLLCIIASIFVHEPIGD